MHVVVCIKQVPETTAVRINPETNTVIREGVKSIINPFDMFAIEEGVRLKERFGGTATVITMGPPQAESALREALALGMDEAILISDRAFAGSDTWATSYTLSCAIRKLNRYDVILCGKQASDGDTAQVGPGLSVQLDIPQVTYVKKIADVKDGCAKVERMTEDGYEVLEVQLPALLTVVKEINTPRLPSLKGLMRAKQATVTRWAASDLQADPKLLGLSGSPTLVTKVFTPKAPTGGQMLQGDVSEIASQLVEALRNGVL
jgi:electron transfer flavoprotein beta subunit